ncbi:MAG: hypothetical protein GF418_09545 [Chitinivibrionales bacterium]|nr:hypothetical protein [Chitinivibrionales bacterium]MBD3395853.1 hypothetical protein [Chitinivibrionales bacterium]
MPAYWPGTRDGRFEKRLRAQIVKEVPSMQNMLADTKCTAVLAINQWLALNYHRFLTSLGVRIPGDLSILSFDNYLPYAPHPVSTLDFRLEMLGYSTAHIFINDIPVKADRWGLIRTESQYIDRGSLAPPRAGRTVTGGKRALSS